MSKFHVYAIGNALVDIEYHSSIQQLQNLSIDKGVMTLIDESRQKDLMAGLGGSHESMACGGSAANTIIALADLGAEVHFDCRVANDDAGQFYASDLKQAGVSNNLSANSIAEGHTGKCLVFVTPDADRTMNTFLGVSAELDETGIDPDAIQQAEYVYIEGYLVSADCTRAAAIKARQIAENVKAKTAITLSDPNMVTFFRDGIKEMIGDGVDLLFANEEEACGLFETDCLDVAIPQIQKICKRFAITRGKEGALLFDGNDLIKVDGHAVDAIDTLGAGDLFAGCFLYGLTNGMDFQLSGEFASKASSVIVTQFGPRLEASHLRQIHEQFKTGN